MVAEHWLKLLVIIAAFLLETNANRIDQKHHWFPQMHCLFVGSSHKQKTIYQVYRMSQISLQIEQMYQISSATKIEQKLDR